MKQATGILPVSYTHLDVYKRQITNIGDSHIEHFGSREKILEAKSEIFHHAHRGAFAVLNGDDPLLRTLAGKLPHEILWCGAGEDNDYRAGRVESDGKSRITCELKTPDTLSVSYTHLDVYKRQ